MSEFTLSDIKAHKERRGASGEMCRQSDRDLVAMLTRKLDFQQLLSRISATFAGATSDLVGSRIELALELLGAFLQVDRAFLFRISDDAGTFRTPSIWYANGISRERMAEGSLPLDTFPFIMRKTLEGSPVVINALEELPAEAGNELGYCRDRGIKSFLMVPVFLDGKPIGSFGFDAIRHEKHWDQELIAQLQLVSNLIAAELDRERQAQLAGQRARFQMFISNLSTAFINMPVADVRDAIQDALGSLALFMDADMVTLINRDPVTHDMAHTNQWVTPDIDVDIDFTDFEKFDIERDAPWVHAQLARGEPVVISRRSDFPEEAVNEIYLSKQYGIEAVLWSPYYVTNEVAGYIVLNTIGRAKNWAQSQLGELRIVGSIFANALVRASNAEAIDRRLRFEEMISSLSGKLINVPTGGVIHQVRQALSDIGAYFDVDRVCMVSFNDKQVGQLGIRRHEVSGEIMADDPVYQFVFEEHYPYLASLLRSGDVFHFTDPGQFPAAASNERDYVRLTGIKDSLMVPVEIEGKVQCAIMLDSLRANRSWDEEVVQRLRTLSEILANALIRESVVNKLVDKLEFENLLTTLSAAFINLPDTSVDERISEALRLIGEFTECDEVFLYQFSEQADESGISHGWFRSGESRELNFHTNQFFEVFPWAGAKLEQQESIVFGSLDELPAEAGDERDYLQSIGLESSIVTPLILERQLRGALFVQSFHKQPWQAHLVEQLKLAAQIFFSAIRRRSAGRQLQSALRRISDLKEQLEAENIMLQKEIEIHQDHAEIVGSSPVMKQVIAQVEQVAPLGSTVLIQGETGTGKEVIANLIHKLSERAGRNMIRVNCAALPAALIEAELFGREKGAYTGAASKQIGRFELADGSTIFLDEIGELPLELQAKLLRVLQDGEFERLGSTQTVKVDVRVIAATNRALGASVHEGDFREDLYYRLNVFPITVPPLRERRGDIPALVWHFVREYGDTMGKSIDMISKSTLKHLQAYAWPGNVRELRNVIERAMILSRSGTLAVRLDDSDSQRQTGQTLAEVQADHICAILGQTNWRIRGEGGAAQILDMNPCTLESRMKKLGIRRPRK